MKPRIDVGVLGATGMVGQQFVRLLAGHPWFNLAWLAASERSEGRSYSDAASWRLPWPLPAPVGDLPVHACRPGQGPRLVFSALDASAAKEIEVAFARAGHIVVSNARSWRMDPLVPLLVPEINGDHLDLLSRQQRERGWPGAIVTNPNCSTVVLTMALAPLRTFGLESVLVTTMQAISGAGYPGVASLDIVGNVIPGIPGEEEKMETETQKILGTADTPHPVLVSAHTNRVPVVDGHTETVSVRLSRRVTAEEVIEAFRTFRGRPQELGLPSAPAVPVIYLDTPNRPQPRLDAERDGGMTVSIGRVRPCPVLDMKFVALGHNTVRGAAGAAILNAELMVGDGKVEG
jgi:aspartate-semialdehyde dehydrogenase